jgi:hypothetical protein
MDALGKLCADGKASAEYLWEQVDLLVDGFDRLTKLWQAAKSGLM